MRGSLDGGQQRGGGGGLVGGGSTMGCLQPLKTALDTISINLQNSWS